MLIAAEARQRQPGTGFFWFSMSLIVSPLVAGFMLLLMLPLPPFEPEWVKNGFPYRVRKDKTIDAMMTGGLVRFRDMEQFNAAVEGRDMSPPLREQVSMPKAAEVTAPDATATALWRPIGLILLALLFGTLAALWSMSR
jgi:hypothetical protein